MLPFTTAAIEVEAVVRSAKVPREPEVKVASVRLRVAYVQTSEALREEVRVRVPFVHTSAARVPNVVRDLEAEDQTEVGIVARSDVEAVRTVALVFELIVEIGEDICELVFALMFEASEVEAARIVAFTSVVTLAILVPSEVEAVRT